MKYDEFLLEEHKQLIQLYMSEDNLVWNQTYFYIVLNAGLLSVIGSLSGGSFSLNENVVSIILCFFGGFVGLSWYLIFQRTLIHRNSRMYRAMMIEDELKKKGIPIYTLRSCESRIHKKSVLADPDGSLTHPNIRKFKWSERKEALRIIHKGMIVSGLLWFLTGLIWLMTLILRTFN